MLQVLLVVSADAGPLVFDGIQTWGATISCASWHQHSTFATKEGILDVKRFHRIVARLPQALINEGQTVVQEGRHEPR
jgi:hypothetical protein